MTSWPLAAPAGKVFRDARRSSAGLTLAVVAVVAVGCGRHGGKSGGGPGASAPSKAKLQRVVELAPIRQAELTSSVETVGYLDAEGQTNISPGVAGVVEEVLFREGDWVVKDVTLLARIEPKRYEALLAQAEAMFKKAEASVRRAKAAAKRAEAGERDAKETLSLRQVLLSNIVRAGSSATTESRQEATANVELAKARLELAKADVEVAKAESEAAEKEQEATRALRELAEHNLRRSRVTAPYTGQINTRMVTRGSYVEDKTTIATMADLSKLRLVGYVPEKWEPVVRQMVRDEQGLRAAFLAGNCLAGPWAALGAVAADLGGDAPSRFKVEFELRSYPGPKFHARIFFLSDVASVDTRQFECKAELPRTGPYAARLRPGLTAKIRVPLPGNPTSLVIPEESVKASERGFIAYLPRAVTGRDGAAEYVAQQIEVELGQRVPGLVELRGARLHGKPLPLRAGDLIVRKGAESLEDGTPLAIPKAQQSLLRKSYSSP